MAQTNEALYFEKLPESYQEDIVTAILFHGDEYVTELVERVDPELLDPPLDDIAYRGLEFWRTYHQAPGRTHIDDLFAYIFDDKKHKKYDQYNRLLRGMAAIEGKLNTEYVLHLYNEFLKGRAVRETIGRAAEAYQQKKPDEAVRVMAEIQQRVVTAADDEGLVTVRASDVKMKPVLWLWRDFIPLGRLTIIGGLPKVNKSTVALAIAAIATRGDKWPDGERCEYAEDVLVFSAEDKEDDTIVPRLQVMKANLANVEIFRHTNLKSDKEAEFDLKRDLPFLERKIKANKHLSVIIIDPLASYLGEKIDGFNEVKVRAVLRPLSKLAAKYDIAIICIMHFKKGLEQVMMYQLAGSLAFTATARAVFICQRDKEDRDRRLLLPAGGNLARNDKGFAFRIVPETFHSENVPIKAIGVEWEEQIEGTADEQREAEQNNKETKVDVATAFLRGVLSNGSRLQDELEQEAEAIGIKPRTLRRAKETLGVVPERRGFGEKGCWHWSLPQVRTK